MKPSNIPINHDSIPFISDFEAICHLKDYSSKEMMINDIASLSNCQNQRF